MRLYPGLPGCAECAMAHPDFGKSVNPISTRGDRLCQPNYYWHTRIFRPSDGPVYHAHFFVFYKKYLCSTPYRNQEGQIMPSILLLYPPPPKPDVPAYSCAHSIRATNILSNLYSQECLGLWNSLDAYWVMSAALLFGIPIRILE